MNKRVLLLTACVTPAGMAYTALQDPHERERQYLNALSWYIKNTSLRIVMCENTNYQLPQEFSAFIKNGRLEYLTFNGNNSFDKSRGKGVGESLIIQHAIKYSKFIADADVIMKMTGRQILKNINFIVHHCTKDNCIYANNGRYYLNLRFAFSQFYICPKSFYKEYFLKGISRLDDSKFYYFEHLLADSIAEWKADGRGGSSEFWMPLLIDGTSGSCNAPLEHPSFPWLRSVLKYWLHRCGIYKKMPFGFFSEQQVRQFRKI